MDNEKYVHMRKIIEKQEEMLRFARFSHGDAWELGKFLVHKVRERQIELAIAIRKPNGHILFQYASEKTNLNNQNWMQRKFNTVLLMDCSSLLAWVNSFISGEQVHTHGLSEAEYVFCGGGFPIRLKTGELAAVITVSNLPHVEDHQFLVEALSEWLSVEDVPAAADID
jgi:uncharacterized protein (UPF0303 family)